MKSARRYRFALALVFLAHACANAVAFDLEGHRGARGLAPENTIPAFERALAIGVTTIETDVAVTRDGVVVISHDPFLNPEVVRGADGRWLSAPGPAIRTLDFATLSTYDIGRLDPASKYAQQFPQQRASDGARFPRLSELFALAKASGKAVRFNVETKITPTSGDATPDPATFAQLVIAVVRDAGVGERVTIQSFDWRTLREVSRTAPDLRTACLTIQTPNNDTVTPDASGASPWHAGLSLRDNGGSMPALVKAAGCRVWSMFWRNLGADDVTRSHSIGIEVLPWTVNEPADMARLIDMGVDGIITDYPDRLRAVMAEKKLPLP